MRDDSVTYSKDGDMVKVTAKGPHENVQKLLRRFKKACENAGVMREIKRKAYFEKPSDKRRRERRRRRREAQKQLVEGQSQSA